jgi:hypothetical protein
MGQRCRPHPAQTRVTPTGPGITPRLQLDWGTTACSPPPSTPTTCEGHCWRPAVALLAPGLACSPVQKPAARRLTQRAPCLQVPGQPRQQHPAAGPAAVPGRAAGHAGLQVRLAARPVQPPGRLHLPDQPLRLPLLPAAPAAPAPAPAALAALSPCRPLLRAAALPNVLLRRQLVVLQRVDSQAQLHGRQGHLHGWRRRAGHAEQPHQAAGCGEVLQEQGQPASRPLLARHSQVSGAGSMNAVVARGTRYQPVPRLFPLGTVL